jgi:hypothetical protein
MLKQKLQLKKSSSVLNAMCSSASQLKGNASLSFTAKVPSEVSMALFLILSEPCLHRFISYKFLHLAILSNIYTQSTSVFTGLFFACLFVVSIFLCN